MITTNAGSFVHDNLILTADYAFLDRRREDLYIYCRCWTLIEPLDFGWMKSLFGIMHDTGGKSWETVIWYEALRRLKDSMCNTGRGIFL